MKMRPSTEGKGKKTQKHIKINKHQSFDKQIKMKLKKTEKNITKT